MECLAGNCEQMRHGYLTIFLPFLIRHEGRGRLSLDRPQVLRDIDSATSYEPDIRGHFDGYALKLNKRERKIYSWFILVDLEMQESTFIALSETK